MAGTVGKTWYRDLTGHRYGMLTVLSFHSKIGNFRKWNCRCGCGTECVKYGHQIRAGAVVSCGCEQRRKASETGKARASDLSGSRFGRLIVVGRSGSNKNNRSAWLCRCDCGNEKVILGNSLTSGNSESCGCIQKETMHEIRWNPKLSQEDREGNQHRGVAFPGLHLWRKEVFRRDGWTCQACFDKSHKGIVAHHKESWGSTKELRLDVDNGVTVCERHHKDFHSAYGWGNNTASQWDEFVSSEQQRAVV